MLEMNQGREWKERDILSSFCGPVDVLAALTVISSQSLSELFVSVLQMKKLRPVELCNLAKVM